MFLYGKLVTNAILPCQQLTLICFICLRREEDLILTQFNLWSSFPASRRSISIATFSGGKHAIYLHSIIGPLRSGLSLLFEPLLESFYPPSVLFFVLLLAHLHKQVVVNVVVTILALVLLLIFLENLVTSTRTIHLHFCQLLNKLLVLSSSNNR